MTQLSPHIPKLDKPSPSVFALPSRLHYYLHREGKDGYSGVLCVGGHGEARSRLHAKHKLVIDESWHYPIKVWVLKSSGPSAVQSLSIHEILFPGFASASMSSHEPFLPDVNIEFPEQQRKGNKTVFESPNDNPPSEFTLKHELTATTSTVSETDPEDSFPSTPDSKYSGGAHYPFIGTSRGAESHQAKHHSNNNHHFFHPLRQPPCFQDIHTFDSQLGRPQADYNNQLGAPDSKSNDVFLNFMDELSPASCRYIVHYKEAVRERQRMRLFTTYWELEETNRLRTLLTSLYAEADLEFRRTERETQGLLKALVTKQTLSRTTADVEYLTATRQCNKTSLRETDAQLDLLQDHLKLKQSIRNLGDTSNCAANGPMVQLMGVTTQPRGIYHDAIPGADSSLVALPRDEVVCFASESLVVLPFASIGQPLAGNTYPNHDDSDSDMLRNAGFDPTAMSLQLGPSLSQHAHSHQHAGAVQPHASGSAPQPSHWLPPADVPIYHDHNDAYSEHRYDPSTNPYLQGMPVMPTPSPWHIPSYPQVHTPPSLFDNQLLPANPQFYENFSSSSAGNLALDDDISSVPQLPPNQGIALDIPYPSFNPIHDPFNLEAPAYMSPPDVNNSVSQMHDNIVHIEPTQITPSKIVSVTPRYPINLNAFIPEFTQPVLSKDRDVLLPPNTDDEPMRNSIENATMPKEDRTFLFYGGPNDRRGRRGNRGARYMAQAHLIYNDKNRDHRHIVRSAKTEITKHAINVSSLSDEADRLELVETQGAEWASHNLGTLYLTLSETCRSIMQCCRKHACNLVVDGFSLRLPIWSEGSEREHQEVVIAHLLDDRVFPPNFVMRLGADNLWYFLENEVVLNVILDTAQELKLFRYLEDLNSLACAAAAAVCCGLERVRGRISSDAEFSGAAFKDLYTRLMNYIKETIEKSPVLRKRWEDFKKAIMARLAQLAQ
ncbi:hypothetical protein C8R48DRAFT_675865 [Suillus tomentosus]|nr:hypothetical protein C8R48DRAFT_675865 [Suillus tomentosus]